ncbi:hypothetical protein RJ640_015156 [Escallonia rubra]|uniref:Ribosomal protein L9 n=1 Tax=Escallonia rubra TaxID=112253 RepID=A0AA88RQ28_9ASTE|nr:hypothetical protein RJ640_015156 [Escallonia rubra]
MMELESNSNQRANLTRDFKHLNLDFQLITDAEAGQRKLKVDTWFGSRKTTVAIRTALSHVGNLITGVTTGYRYKMRFVYAHFPINANISSAADSIEIRNFLGEKKHSNLAWYIGDNPMFYQNSVTGRATLVAYAHDIRERFVSESGVQEVSHRRGKNADDSTIKLPDEVLLSSISLLTLDEAGRTSILFNGQ